MKNVYTMIVVLGLGLSGCASAPDSKYITNAQLEREAAITDQAQEKVQKQLALVPDWFLLPPGNDSEGVYGVGSGESRKIELAMKKASMNAQYELAKSFSQALSGNERSYQREGSEQLTEQYTKVVDSLVATVPLNGYETVQQRVFVVDEKFVAYKLIRLTYKRFAQSIKENQPESHQGEIKAAFSELEKRLSQEGKKR